MSTGIEQVKSTSSGAAEMAGETRSATVRIPRGFLGPGRWRAVRDGSRLGFMVRKFFSLYPVRGHFAEFTVEAQIPSTEADEATPPQLVIQAASIDTGIKLRDKHLRSGDFLDVEHFPQIEFRAERIEPQGQDQFRISGPLTIHGVTHPVEVVGRVREPGADIRQIRAAGTLDRYEFEVKALYAEELNLGRKVHLELELTFERVG